MKKHLVLQFAMVVVCAQAANVLAAANPDTGPGCGLGKLVWAEYKTQKNIAPQVMMATTNVIGLYTFAISTGTSGCTNDGVIMADHKTAVFASLSFENLSQEMAQGHGEHLASLATLMGVPEDQHPAFFAMTQERYATLIEAGDASPLAMIKALNEAVVSDQVLARAPGSR